MYTIVYYSILLVHTKHYHSLNQSFMQPVSNHSYWFTKLLNQSISHSLTFSLTHLFIQSLALKNSITYLHSQTQFTKNQSLASSIVHRAGSLSHKSFIQGYSYSVTHSITHSNIQSPSHSFTYLLPYSLKQSLSQALTHPFTHSTNHSDN